MLIRWICLKISYAIASVTQFGDWRVIPRHTAEEARDSRYFPGQRGVVLLQRQFRRSRGLRRQFTPTEVPCRDVGFCSYLVCTRGRWGRGDTALGRDRLTHTCELVHTGRSSPGIEYQTLTITYGYIYTPRKPTGMTSTARAERNVPSERTTRNTPA